MFQEIIGQVGWVLFAMSIAYHLGRIDRREV